MSTLLIGAVLAALALAYVLHPLFRRSARRAADATTDSAAAPKDAAVRALREIEFDRATGKLSDADYESLKAQYTARALTEMRAELPAVDQSAPVADLAEILIRNARAGTSACRRCGTTPPEPDAVYCSACGAYLPGACATCGASIDETDARFCASCGGTLAA